MQRRIRLLLTALLALPLLLGLGAAPAAAADTVIEAENAALSGGARVETEHAGYSGTGYVGGLTDGNKGSAAAAFAVTATQAGAHDVELRYANGTGVGMTLSLYVNGAKATQLALPATGGWASWGAVTAAVNLNAGANQVAVRFDASDSGNVNLDRLAVTVGDDPGGPAAPRAVRAPTCRTPSTRPRTRPRTPPSSGPTGPTGPCPPRPRAAGPCSSTPPESTSSSR
nr:hypothetical protein GCM10025732_32280 [Glycomyces mayteni]